MKITAVQCDAPCMRKRPERGEWEYALDWCCIVVTDEGVIKLNVAKSFWTDLASVPQALKGLIDNGSADYGVLIASQFHDACYAANLLSRELSDRMFYLLLRHAGMGLLKAQMYYRAVRWFGQKAYDSNEECLHDRLLCRITWGAH